MIRSNGNRLFLLKGSSSGQFSNCFYDFFGEIIMTPEVNLYSSCFSPHTLPPTRLRA